MILLHSVNTTYSIQYCTHNDEEYVIRELFKYSKIIPWGSQLFIVFSN